MPPRRKLKPKSADHAALGRAIEEVRREASLTLEALADRIGKEFPPLGKLERGLSNSTYASLLRVARGLEVELSVIIERAERIRDSGLDE
jgi:transcriptional regulator with XRE-family HTH domain